MTLPRKVTHLHRMKADPQTTYLRNALIFTLHKWGTKDFDMHQLYSIWLKIIVLDIFLCKYSSFIYIIPMQFLKLSFIRITNKHSPGIHVCIMFWVFFQIGSIYINRTKKLDLCLHINKARGKTNRIVMLQNLQKLYVIASINIRVCTSIMIVPILNTC